MNPDLLAAVDRLGQQGILTPAQAGLFGRVARRELVSVRPELRLLLYGGVLAVMGGVGLLVRQNLDRIGPVAIAAALWLAAAAALLWALRHAPPFSWGPSASPHLAFDYILLLGVLLTGAALGYLEVQFTPLGAAQSLRPFFAVATALVPVLTIAWGLGSRRRLLINAGLIGLLASMVTLRFYVQVAPLWVVLLLGGFAIGLALALRRYLDSGRVQQRYGFTAEPLFADPEGRSALELAASVASLSPAARRIERSSFEGGGGRFGGGGASGSF